MDRIYTDKQIEQLPTTTGHIVGEVYRCDYWGFAYKVLGETENGEVEVECIDQGRSHVPAGKVWTHRTHVGEDTVIA